MSFLQLQKWCMFFLMGLSNLIPVCTIINLNYFSRQNHLCAHVHKIIGAHFMHGGDSYKYNYKVPNSIYRKNVYQSHNFN